MIVPLSVKVTAQIGGQSYPIVDAEITYAVGLIATGTITLAVGSNMSTRESRTAVSFARGTPAQVLVTPSQQVTSPGGSQLIKSGQTVLFDGLVDSDGPVSLAFGQFGVQVRLVGRLKRLDTGTLQSNEIQPKSFLDTSHPIQYLNAARENAGQLLAGSAAKAIMPEMYVDTGAVDMWASLRGYLIQIAQTGVAAQTGPNAGTQSALLGQMQKILTGSDTTGGGGETAVNPNTQAANELAKVLGSLQLLGLAGVSKTFRYVALKAIMQDRYHSFFSILNDLGFLLSFRLLENPTGSATVPFNPFSLSSDQYVALDPGSILSVGKLIRDPVSYSGCVLVAGGLSVLLNSPAMNYIPGAWIHPASGGQKDLLGFTLSEVAPAFLFRDSALQSFDGVPGAQGVYIGDISMAPGGNNGSENTMGNRYARHHCLEVNYRGHAASITCPLRFDLGLLKPVKFTPPLIGGQQAGPPVYGIVSALTFKINAQQRIAQTSVELGYLRSQDQFSVEQSGALTTHPFWTNTYTGKRFDEPPA